MSSSAHQLALHNIHNTNTQYQVLYNTHVITYFHFHLRDSLVPSQKSHLPATHESLSHYRHLIIGAHPRAARL